MDFLHKNLSTGSLVEKNPEYVNSFEKLRLDYSRKGNTTLKEATDEKKSNSIDVFETLKYLQPPGSAVNKDGMSIQQSLKIFYTERSSKFGLPSVNNHHERSFLYAE